MTSANLGPGWERGSDGLWFRRAARVLLLDEDDHILLVRGHDVDRPERSWWFTIGGGIDPGENAHDAAVRETFEETGIRLASRDLIGPVWLRSAIFDFEREHVRQDEEFFLARVQRPAVLDDSGWTDVERRFMDETRWWAAADLADAAIEVFPHGLGDLLLDLLPGWDGTVTDLDLVTDSTPADRTPADRAPGPEEGRHDG